MQSVNGCCVVGNMLAFPSNPMTLQHHAINHCADGLLFAHGLRYAPNAFEC